MNLVPDEQPRAWEFVTAPPRCAPGAVSMVGYRALHNPGVVHRGMPSPTLTFIVSLDEGVQAAATPEGLRVARPNPVLLGGLQVQAAHVRQHRGQAGVQLAVHSLAARRLFGVPSAELGAIDFDAGRLLGRRAAELHERVAEARHWPDAFAVIAEGLRDAWRRRDGATVRPDVARAWQLLETSRGRLPVSLVAERIGVSPRHLTTLFRQEVGRSPKTVAMLMRFRHATVRIADSARRCGSVDLAAVAADAGYSDQAHLTPEFTRFAGAPPRRWLAEEFRNIQDGGHSCGAHCEHDWIESDSVVDPAGP